MLQVLGSKPNPESFKSFSPPLWLWCDWKVFRRWGHLTWSGDLTLGDLDLKFSGKLRNICPNSYAKNIREMFTPPPPSSWARVNFWMRGLLSSGIALCQRYWHVPFLRLCHQAANQGKMSFSSYDVGGPAGGGGASQRWPTRTDSGQTQGRCFRSDRRGLFIQVRRAGTGTG